MIDPADKQTQPLPLDEQPAKKRRGRPSTGKAMTPAEKQRAYRDRQKAIRQNNLNLSGLDITTIIHALSYQRAKNQHLKTVRESYSELIDRLEAIRSQE